MNDLEFIFKYFKNILKIISSCCISEQVSVRERTRLDYRISFDWLFYLKFYVYNFVFMQMPDYSEYGPKDKENWKRWCQFYPKKLQLEESYHEIHLVKYQIDTIKESQFPRANKLG